MNDTKKPQVPNPQQRELSLTELAERNQQLSTALAGHTAARNFLWSVATGQEPLPTLTISSAVPDNNLQVHNASVDMNRLPQEVIETVLVMVIEHEEKMAFDTWKEIANNAAQACGVIQKLKNAQEQQRMQQTKAEQDDFPNIVPLPQRGDQNVEPEPQEVPRGWPGRPDPRPPGT